MATNPTSLKLEDNTRERLKRLAEAQQRSVHWIMREAIEKHLDNEEKREALRQELVSRWEHYQDTGLHVTGKEASNWLKRLARGENPPRPRPHT
jgi:predicted transcriptional regulator